MKMSGPSAGLRAGEPEAVVEPTMELMDDGHSSATSRARSRGRPVESVQSQATLTAPFPYFGGKRRAAQLVWDALGDPGGYVEPFCGSAAVLLARPRFTGRRVETLNDADGWLVNTWRAIQHAPDQVATHAHGPVTEIDYHARLAFLQPRQSGVPMP
jgi:hypothetical protein